MLCEHGNTAPCVECDVEPLEAEVISLREQLAQGEDERLRRWELFADRFFGTHDLDTLEQMQSASHDGPGGAVGEIIHDYNLLKVRWYEEPKYGRFKSGDRLFIHPPIDQDSFQARVAPWVKACFGSELAASMTERNHRFLEEALELVQSLGCSKDEALNLVEYVYSRSVGDPPQEVGGVRVTLAALCAAAGLHEDECAETELTRVNRPEMITKIREKQKRKPSMSTQEAPDGDL